MAKIDSAAVMAIEEVIRRNRATLEAIPGFVAARAGYPIRAGKVVQRPALLIYVERKLSNSEVPAGGQVPVQIEGVETDTLTAGVEMILKAKYDIELQGAALAAKPTYKEPEDGNIDSTFEVDSKFTCHVGPDAGPGELLEHLARAKKTLTVGMYDFNADYIAKPLIEHVLAEDVQFTLTLDDGLKADEKKIRDKLRDKMPQNYTGWMVMCRYNTRFPTAYHIKVSVADSKHMWLSSGNWTTRSQPNIKPAANAADRSRMFSAGNREWHICVSDAALAKEFEKYILYDAQLSEEEGTALAAKPPERPSWQSVPVIVVSADDDAALAPPRVFPTKKLPAADRAVKVQPVLSPDNYVPQIRKLISSAKKSLYIQMPYITWSDAQEDQVFRDLILLIADKSNELEDVRIILGKSDAQVKIPLLAEKGMNDECVRTQGSLHNKGFIADGQCVLVSSHNWSSDGVLRNRDAGVIVHDEEIAHYYSEVFLWDWENRAKAYIDSAALTVRVEPARIAVVEGEHIMTLNEYLNP